MHRSRLSPVAILLAAMITLAGCTRPEADPAQAPTPTPSAATPTAEPPSSAPPAALGPETHPEAAALFPSTDREIPFAIWDAGATKAAQPVEQWIREGDRLVMASNGKPYAIWLFDADGVWRLDPKGGGALLRYIPATFKDGETWRQRSGDAEVWFSLTQDDGSCASTEGIILSPQKCWTLTVINRAEVTTFRFAPDAGPTVVKAVNYAQPALSFNKRVMFDQSGRRPSDAARKAVLEKAPPPTAPRAAIIPSTAAAFAAVGQALPGFVTVRADLDGDGQQETLRGPLDAWTMADIEIFDHNGTRLATRRIGHGEEHRIGVVRFRGASQSFALVQTRGVDGMPFPEMTIARLQRFADTRWLEGSRGWERDTKAESTAASRVAITDDGLVTVELDLGDPARHTRIRQYRFDPVTFEATQLTESVRAEGKELLYPADPLGVLQAAFMANWYKLGDELPRYFATKEAAAAFQADKRISAIAYRPGGVTFASVSQVMPQCNMQISPATLQANGPTPFLATYAAYEWGTQVWGTVTFSTDAQGRPVIQQLTVNDSCEAGH